MKSKHITEKSLTEFRRRLTQADRSPGTVEKYCRDMASLSRWLGTDPLTQARLNDWKATLQAQGAAPATVNAMLASANAFCKMFGVGIYAKYLRLQRRLFRAADRELTQEEYSRLVHTTLQNRKPGLALLIETMAACGIRVSEVKYITVEAAQNGRAVIALKGKIREILLPEKLCKKLLKYAEKRRITRGELFRTRTGRSMDRRQVWAEMKKAAAAAGVSGRKVYPHNLRHLFARVFYRATRDVAKLADVLGHSSIETTRIYLIGTGEEHARQLDRLGLII